MKQPISTQEYRRRLERAWDKRLLQKLEALVPHGRNKRKVQAVLAHRRAMPLARFASHPGALVH